MYTMSTYDVRNKIFEDPSKSRLRMKQEIVADIQHENTAPIIAQRLHQEIINYQASLPDEEDVTLALAHFGQTMNIIIQSIGYIGYNLIVFHGVDNFGKPLELIQNINQLDFLLTAQSKPEPEVPKRTIGFLNEENQ